MRASSPISVSWLGGPLGGSQHHNAPGCRGESVEWEIALSHTHRWELEAGTKARRERKLERRSVAERPGWRRLSPKPPPPPPPPPSHSSYLSKPCWILCTEAQGWVHHYLNPWSSLKSTAPSLSLSLSPFCSLSFPRRSSESLQRHSASDIFIKNGCIRAQMSP